MRSLGILFVALGLASCAADESTSPSPVALSSLEGSWSRALSEECSVSLRMDPQERRYAAHRVCALDPPAIGDDVENGAVDLSVAGSITFRPETASCPSGVHSPFTAPYTVEADSLALQVPGGSLDFVRLPPGGPYTGAYRVGCWAGGEFTDHPIEALTPAASARSGKDVDRGPKDDAAQATPGRW
jgi:hypothetical protein